MELKSRRESVSKSKSLRRLKMEKSLSNSDIAKAANVSLPTVSYWLNGKHEPSEKYLKIICFVFSVDYKKFINWGFE